MARFLLGSPPMISRREGDEPGRRGFPRWQVLATKALSYAGILVLVLIVGGGVFVASGAFSMNARKGHLFFVRDLLPFARSRSVSVHASGTPPPELSLDSPAMIARGAAHYADGCLPCHGAPGVPRDAFAEHMLPRPPSLAGGPVVADRRDVELHWVVHNGLKFAGMPSWPEGSRPDEPWSVVSFLRRIREMEPARYRKLAGLDRERAAGELVAGDPQLTPTTARALAACTRCHGADGTGDRDGAFPNLSLLSEAYLRRSLHAYEEGTRHSGIMEAQLQPLSKGQLDDLAAYYGRQPAKPANPAGRKEPSPEGRWAWGRKIAEGEGIPERGLAPCDSCHGVAEVTETTTDDDELAIYPRIRGQYAPYLRQQLHAWNDAARGGARQEDSVVRGAHDLAPEEIECVSSYLAEHPGR